MRAREAQARAREEQAHAVVEGLRAQMAGMKLRDESPLPVASSAAAAARTRRSNLSIVQRQLMSPSVSNSDAQGILGGPYCAVTDRPIAAQSPAPHGAARAQFTLWSVFPANLLISQNVLAWSDYALETYSNAELISINQDALASPARRIVGGDLPFPCHGGGGGLVASVVAAVCNASDASQLFAFDAASGAISSTGPFPGAVLAAIDCATEDGTPVALYSPGSADKCAGAGRTWTHWPNGTVTNKNSGTCLDVAHGNGPTVDVWTCNGGTNQNFSFAEGQVKAGSDSMCLSAQALVPHTCDNVWGRALADGGFALAFVNNDVDADSSAITCDGACFAALLNGTTPGALRVRDLWTHEDVGTISAPFSWTAKVNGSGFAAAYRLTPS